VGSWIVFKANKLSKLIALGRREEIGSDDPHKHTENFQEER
jgi:hypothetical protein